MRRSPGSRLITIATLFVALTICIAACSSSTDNASSSDTQPAGSDTTTSNAVNAAQQFLTTYEKLPTSVGIDTPVNVAPTPGKTIVFLQCEVAQCAEAKPIYQAAVQAAGWTLKIVNYQAANPATFTAALETALRYKPVGVVFVAEPFALWSAMVPKYAAAGVAMLPLGGGADVPVNKTIVRNTVGPPDIELQADLLANWFIADSKGHGNAVFWGVPQLPVQALTQQEFLADVKAKCPGCSVKVITQTLPDVEAGDAPSVIVSAVRSDPGAKYVILSNMGLAQGLVPALKAAGVTDVKIAGNDASAQDEAAIRAGTEAAGVPLPLTLAAWQSVDAAVRFSEGMNVPSVTTPVMLLTTRTMAASNVEPSDVFSYPANYAQVFEQLWKVG
jgi:ribose transport system substrate-binding protein